MGEGDRSQAAQAVPAKARASGAERFARYLRLTSGLSLAGFAERTRRFLREELGIEQASIAVLEDDGAGLRLFAGTLFGSAPADEETLLAPEESSLSRLALERRAVYQGTPAELERDYPFDRRLEEAGIRSRFAVPLWSSDSPLGVLDLGARVEEGFSEPLRAEIDQLAPYVAQSLAAAVLMSSLRESEGRYRKLGETMDQVFWFTAPGRVLYVSPAFERIWQRPTEELLKDPRLWVETIHEEDRERVVGAFRRLVSGEEERYGNEYRIVRPDGSERWISDQAAAIRDARGKAVRVSGISRDVTEEKRARLEALDNEARFRAFAEAVTDGVLFHDGARILDANPALLDMVGYELDELVGRSPLRLVVPADRERVRRRIETRSDTVEQITALRKDGGELPVSVSARDLSYRDIDARVVWVQDMRERERMLGALRETEDRYRNLFETSQDAIYLARLDGAIVDANAAMVELFGYDSREQMLRTGNPADHFVDPEDRKQARRLLLEEGSLKDHPLQLLTRDGRELQVQVTANLVRGAAGEVVGYQCVVRDMSEQLRLERQLFQSQKMEAIGRLAGGIAHDFNNLLTVITGFCDLALVQLDPEGELAADLREIQSASERATKLTEQLLAFSRKQVLQPRVLDLNAIVGEFQGFLQRTLGTDVEIALELDEKLGLVKADPAQVEQVLMNLAVNAREAMPQGGQLTIATRNETVGEGEERHGVELVPGRYSLLSVSDSGVGMDEETVARVFEPFFTTKEAKGTGLGLATVYGIVKQSGGYIWVDSALDEGTTFTIYLPHAEGEVELPSATPRAADRVAGSEALLLVEDDEPVREFARRCLEAEGYRVRVAADSQEARRICEEHGEEIELMITDLVMPRGDGVSLAVEVSAERPGMRMLLMSGYADRALENRAEEAAAFPLLQKPFTSEDLTRAVRRVLDG